MKRLIAGMTGICLCGFVSSALAGEKAPQKVHDLADSILAQLGADPVVVKAVQEKNAKGETLDEVKVLDEKWSSTAGIADYMQAMLDNECSQHLQKIADAAPYYSEIFVMDNQGANVCMTDKTSDYWQGDEAKFKKSFNEGKGDIFVDEVKFDDSTQAYLSQVSVPVKDGDKVIGAITIGVDIDKIE